MSVRPNFSPTTLKTLVIVVAKAPIVGKVKTRLCPPLTHEQATRLYTGFLLDTLAIARQLPASVTGIVCPSAADAQALAALTGVDYFVIQKGDGLTAALTESFEQGLQDGFQKIMCISSDNPTLPLTFLQDAVQSLDSAEVVFGPSEDGGYYLVGAKKCYPQLFNNMVWSTDKVLAQTLARLKLLEISHQLLTTWYDLDTIQELERFWQTLPPVGATYTRQALEEFNLAAGK